MVYNVNFFTFFFNTQYHTICCAYYTWKREGPVSWSGCVWYQLTVRPQIFAFVVWMTKKTPTIQVTACSTPFWPAGRAQAEQVTIPPHHTITIPRMNLLTRSPCKWCLPPGQPGCMCLRVRTSCRLIGIKAWVFLALVNVWPLKHLQT